MSDKYEKQIYLAMLAEQCTRYEDMMAFLEDMVKIKTGDLSSDERNLLSIAYKNTISLDRQAIRTLYAYESKEAKKSRLQSGGVACSCVVGNNKGALRAASRTRR